jgi:uncharacterized membrane protein
MLLTIHIAAGGLALILGAVALSVKKGGGIHRRVGRVFVGTMVVMAITATILGILDNGRVLSNVLGGLMTLYFVGTALMTVRPVSPWTSRVTAAGIAIAVGLAFFDILGGIEALNSPGGMLNGVPFAMLFFLAGIFILAAIGDLRILLSGPPRGARRLSRHLWRMCFALFIAAGSFFSVRERVAKILPDPLAIGPMRALPIVLIFGAMFYWLWRLRRRRPPAVVVRNEKGSTIEAA